MAEEIILNLKIGGADQSVTTLGQLKAAIATLKKEQDGLKIGSEAFNKVQADLNKAEQARIDIMKKTPSLFQERIKGAIDESNSLKGLKQQIKEYTAAVIRGEEGAAEKLAELKDKLEDVKDATEAFKGSGVEKLTSSMDLLRDSISNFDADKFTIGLKGIGGAMKAIPIFLIIEGIQFLLEKFKIMDLILSVVTDGINAFTDALGFTNHEAEKTTKTTVAGLQKQQDKVEERYDSEIKLAKAAGKDTTVLEEQKLKAVEDSLQKQVNAYELLAQKKGKLNDDEQKEYEELQSKLLDATTDRLANETKLIIDFNNKNKTLLERRQDTERTDRQNALKDLQDAQAQELAEYENQSRNLLQVLRGDFKARKQYEQGKYDINKYYENEIQKLKDQFRKEDADKAKAAAEKKKKEEEDLQKDILDSIKKGQQETILIQETAIKQNLLYKQDEIENERKLAAYRRDIVINDLNSTYAQRYQAQVDFDAKIKELDDKEAERKRNNTLKKIEDEKIAEQLILENQTASLEERYQARLDMINLQEQQELLAKDLTENQKLQIEQKYYNERLKAERDFASEKQKIVQQEIQFVQQSATAYLNLASIFAQNQEQIKQIQKIQSLVSIAANTATAISNLVAVSFSPSSPDNIMTGGIAAYVKLATGLSTIFGNMAQAKQLISSFEEGGYTGEGNPKDVSTNLGSKSYTYHKDEYVIPSRVLNTPQGAMLASQAESMRLGMSNPFPQIKGFFDGGFTARGMGASANNSSEQMRMMQAVLTSLPAPVVKVTDINKTQTSNQRAITVASL